MHHRDEELRKAVALFRYGLIADVLRLAPGSPDIRRTLHEKAQRTYVIPGTRRTRVAVETMRDWLRPSPSRPIEVVHHAKPAGTATRLDAYANPRVKRHRPSWPLHCDTAPDEPSPSPLAMRNLKEKMSCPCVTSH